MYMLNALMNLFYYWVLWIFRLARMSTTFLHLHEARSTYYREYTKIVSE